MPSNTGTVYVDGKSSDDTNKGGDSVLRKEGEFEKLSELEKRASIILFEAQSQRPLFSKYRDGITICLNRVTISRGGKYSGDEYPIPIENLTSARVFRRFRFATLEVETFGIDRPDPIFSLRVDDARLARRYILALIECRKANINLAGLQIDKIREKLKNIGMVRYATHEKKYHEL